MRVKLGSNPDEIAASWDAVATGGMIAFQRGAKIRKLQSDFEAKRIEASSKRSARDVHKMDLLSDLRAAKLFLVGTGLRVVDLERYGFQVRENTRVEIPTRLADISRTSQRVNDRFVAAGVNFQWSPTWEGYAGGAGGFGAFDDLDDSAKACDRQAKLIRIQRDDEIANAMRELRSVRDLSLARLRGDRESLVALGFNVVSSDSGDSTCDAMDLQLEGSQVSSAVSFLNPSNGDVSVTCYVRNNGVEVPYSVESYLTGDRMLADGPPVQGDRYRFVVVTMDGECELVDSDPPDFI